ncbi:MAG: NAD(P)H-hydrate dehydratase, partial [Spirochaetota bacterium]
LLMNNAGRAVAAHVAQGGWNRVALVCGSGNNGGDGFAAAVYLNAAGIDVTVHFDPDKSGKLSPESDSFYNICAMLGLVEPLTNDFSEYDCITDALFGIGITGAVRPPYDGIIQAMNDSPAWIISVDIPSGLPAAGSVPVGASIVRAQTTVTMGLRKINTVLYPGAAYCGSIVTINPGFPEKLLQQVPSEATVSVFDESLFRGWCDLYTEPTLHKYRAGTVTVIGGFSGYEGALALATRALVQSGCGMSYALTDSGSTLSLRTLPDECVAASLDDDTREEVIAKRLMRSDVCVIGPGLGRSGFSGRVFDTVISAVDECGVRAVLVDGDGLFFLKESGRRFSGAALLVTPHAGEAAHLLDMTSEAIEQDRLDAARKISARYSAYTLLKGARSVMTGGGQTIIATAGNPLLATAGSGDVLCGIAASALCRYADPLRALAVAVHVHGTAADIYRENNPFSFRSGDIIDMIRPALGAISERTLPWMT